MWARIIRAAPILAGVIAAAMASANTESSEWPRIALSGYDPVAYFTIGRAAKGNQEYLYAWGGALYQFATPAHRALFIAQPERYAPQFSGYCVLGIVEGYKVDADPEAWAVVNDRLYLTYNMAVREKLLADPVTAIARAEASWKALAH
jgi:YHS domain-containing protein